MQQKLQKVRKSIDFSVEKCYIIDVEEVDSTTQYYKLLRFFAYNLK